MYTLQKLKYKVRNWSSLQSYISWSKNVGFLNKYLLKRVCQEPATCFLKCWMQLVNKIQSKEPQSNKGGRYGSKHYMAWMKILINIKSIVETGKQLILWTSETLRSDKQVALQEQMKCVNKDKGWCSQWRESGLDRDAQVWKSRCPQGGASLSGIKGM